MLNSIDDLFLQAVKEAPNDRFVNDSWGRWTFAQANSVVDRIVGELRQLWLQRGDRVGIYMRKSLGQVAALLGVSRARGVFVIVDTRLKAFQVRHILEDAGAKHLIVDEDDWGTIRSEPWSDSLSVIVMSPRTCDIINVDESPEARDVSQRGWRTETTMRRDLAALIYTSGSTGMPKGVMVSHGNFLAGVESVVTYLGIQQEDRILGLLPFCFDYGLNQVLCAIRVKCQLVACDYTFPVEILRRIEKEEITVLAGVPSIWVGLCSPMTKARHNRSLHTVRILTNSGGHLASREIAGMKAMFPQAKIFAMYGLTEAFRSTYLPPEQLESRPGSIGQAIPGADVFLVNEDNEETKPGEIGEIVHRGDTVCLGYWNRPEETARVFRPCPSWCPGDPGEFAVYTGDFARYDDEGYLYFVGRRDWQIKALGARVSPLEIESVLLDHKAVVEAVVFGAKDDHAQTDRIVSGVSGPNVDRQELLRHCRKHLPAHMVPKDILVLPSLPKMTNGKIDRNALKEIWKSGQ